MIVSLSIDGHSYNETLLFLQDLSPKEVGVSHSFHRAQNVMPRQILLHDGSRDSVLTRKIVTEFQTRAQIIFINRQVSVAFGALVEFYNFLINKTVPVL